MNFVRNYYNISIQFPRSIENIPKNISTVHIHNLQFLVDESTLAPTTSTTLTTSIQVKTSTDHSPHFTDPCGVHQPAIFNTTLPRNILSPNFPQVYPNDLDCSWIIQTHNLSSIKLTFSHFELENHETCEYAPLHFKFHNICVFINPYPE